jgi:Na+-driven multidrug efflux pump
MSPDPEIARMTAQCLFITGFIQAGFAASIVFSGALRGAGDTMAVMMINLASTIFVRLLGVLVVAHVFHGTLAAIWVVLSLELLTRGVLIYWRFLHGGWRYIRV